MQTAPADRPRLPRDEARASEPAWGAKRYAWDSPEFARVVNLSDAVFAIAMTLLVLNLEAPRVAADRLAGALAGQVPQLVVFGLSFLLVANVWWQHHRIFAGLAWVDPPMIAVNMAMLAGVALVPYPTSLIGAAPGTRAAALPFIGLFVGLALLFLALIVWAWKQHAWRRPLPAELFRWELLDWTANIALMVVALLVAIWMPLTGLAVLAGSSTVISVALTRLWGRPRQALM